MRHRDPGVLHELYVEEDLDNTEVADELDVDRNTIARWLDKHDIRKPYHDPEVLRRAYWEEGKSTEDMADEFGVTGPTILRQMKKHDIPRRTAPQDRPPYFCPAGSDGHEEVHARVDGELKVIGIHRLVAVVEHGYEAVAGNDTHHRNGVPWDNRPSNVTPKTHGDHSSTTAAERDRNADGTLG
jgi:plasmid maintenance system antidote protein VapI